MEYQALLVDEEDYYTVILDEEGNEKALGTDDCEPWDLEDRVYEQWQDKKDLSEEKQESSFKNRNPESEV